MNNSENRPPDNTPILEREKLQTSEDHQGYVATDIWDYEANKFRKIMELDGLSYD